MMTFQDFHQLVARIKHPDRKFGVGSWGSIGFYLYVYFTADGQEWKGRKWFVSKHSEPNEVCQTALKAVLTSLEHEAREHFTVDGKAIYAPHFDLDFLLQHHDQQTHRPPPEHQPDPPPLFECGPGCACNTTPRPDDEEPCA